jgi:GNAT superfamily N-acetyltransferase
MSKREDGDLIPHTCIRLLTEGDVPATQSLSAAAGWNQTRADWLMLLELEPESCLALECDGLLVATTTLICYGSQLAWLGMVLTKGDYRRRGFARLLVAHALEVAGARRVETVKLDATALGMPLYEELGFRAEQPIERWRGRGSGVLGTAAEYGVTLGTMEPIDGDAFPADRSKLLERLMARDAALVCEDGYLLQRDGAGARYLGPCVARTPAVAEALLKSALADRNEPFLWDLLPSNAEAVRLATKFGFERDRRLVRMSRGKKLEEPREKIYAIAGFEFG